MKPHEHPMNPIKPHVRINTVSLAAALAVAAALLNTGCISTERTVYQQPERIKVEFENEAAGRLFYEALSNMQNRHDRNESRTSVSIPVVFNHTHRVLDGENVSFNQAVRRCDTNGDGRITEQEARIFAEQAGKRP